MNFIIEYWVQFLFGFIIALVTFLYKKIEDYKKLMLATKNGVKALLKTKIIENYYFYKKQGGISIYEKEIIHDLYDEYKLLEDNVVIDELVKAIDNLLMVDCVVGGENCGKYISKSSD